MSEAVRLPGEADVVVVGGGVMGVAVTYWLATLGVRALLLEATHLGWGASGRNAGIMLSGLSSLEDPSLVRAVVTQEAIDAQYEERGHLCIASSPSVVAEMRREVARRPAAAPALHVVDRDACEEILGMRIHPRFAGGRWLPSGATVHPARFVRGLAASAIRHGATVVTQARVSRLEDVRRGEAVEVTTSRGRVRSTHVVLACNAGIGLLPRDLARLITPVRGQMMSTDPLPPIFGLGMAVDWGSVYWRQANDGAVVIGGFRDRDQTTERTGRLGLNPVIQSALKQFLPDAFPGLGPVGVRQQWSGIMSCTLDGRPLVGPWPSASRRWVVAGFGGHGLPPALGVGRAVAHAIVGGQIGHELTALDPGRFARARAHRTLREGAA